MNGKIINRASIAKDVGVTVPAYHTSVRKAQRQAPKFYFIDPGIVRGLGRTLSVPLLPQTSAYGEAFEH